MRKAKSNFERGIINRSKECSKVFWSHVRSKLKTKSGVAGLFEDPHDKTSLKTDDMVKAEILQKQFSSVFTREPDGNIPPFDKRTNSSVTNPVITSVLIKKKIKALDTNKSFGPDEIHPKILVELCDIVSDPITLIFNRSFEDGILPKDWKNAHITPIFKKGSRNFASNYRPISLTSIICKIMESIIKDTVLCHLTENQLLTKSQFGFIPGRSATIQLLSYLDNSINSIVNGKVTDTIYFDFAKAFDTVPHRRLLKKLARYGIGGNVLKWINAFLHDRSQIVVVNGVKSSSSPVLSGIPQGSVLGPLLFLVYINDLPDVVRSLMYLFADDTKLSKEINSAHDAFELQTDMLSMEKWSNKWLLQFHPNKCHVLTLGKHQNIIHAHRYILNGQELEHVFEEKDLGITIDHELKFQDHIANKIKTANSIMGLIRRSFNNLDKKLFKTLFTSFVRPHLEYAPAVWHPHLKKNINQLENVQRRATKMVKGFQTVAPEERLQQLELPTLKFRREVNDMVEIYKHFHFYDQRCIPSTFNPQRRPSRKHDFQIVPRVPRDGIRGVQTNSFYYRSIKPWNELPAEVVNSTSIKSFKRSLERAWDDKKYQL